MDLFDLEITAQFGFSLSAVTMSTIFILIGKFCTSAFFPKKKIKGRCNYHRQ